MKRLLLNILFDEEIYLIKKEGIRTLSFSHSYAVFDDILLTELRISGSTSFFTNPKFEILLKFTSIFNQSLTSKF